MCCRMSDLDERRWEVEIAREDVHRQCELRLLCGIYETVDEAGMGLELLAGPWVGRVEGRGYVPTDRR